MTSGQLALSQKSLLSRDAQTQRIAQILLESQKELLEKNQQFKGIREFYGYEDDEYQRDEEENSGIIQRKKTISKKLKKAQSPFGTMESPESPRNAISFNNKKPFEVEQAKIERNQSELQESQRSSGTDVVVNRLSPLNLDFAERELPQKKKQLITTPQKIKPTPTIIKQQILEDFT